MLRQPKTRTPITEQFPEVQLIRSKENLGFAGGNNLGIAQATGEYLPVSQQRHRGSARLSGAPGGAVRAQRQRRYSFAEAHFLRHRQPHSVRRLDGGINPWTGRSMHRGLPEPDPASTTLPALPPWPTARP